MNKELKELFDEIEMQLSREPVFNVKMHGAVKEVKREVERQNKELIEQLEKVTDELTIRIAMTFHDPHLEEIRAGHPVVKAADEVINKYKSQEKEG